MPPLVKLILGHVVVGTLAGWTLLAGLLASDVAGLRSLIQASPDGALAIAMLALFFAVTFGSAASGAAIISLGRDSDRGGGRNRLTMLRFARLPVAAPARRRATLLRLRGL